MVSQQTPRAGRSQRRLNISWEKLILLVILSLAILLRFWQIESVPPGMMHDEAYNGLDALSLIQGEEFPIFHEGWELYADEAHQNDQVRLTRFPMFFEGNYGREPLLVYLMAFSIWLLGATSTAVRIVPAILGVISVLGTFLAAKELFTSSNREPGSFERQGTPILQKVGPLVAAFTMAVFYPVVSFSRLGLRPIAFLPLETLAVYFFWRGVRSSESIQAGTNGAFEQTLPVGAFRPGSFILSGLCLGLGLYTYAAARFLPLLFGSFILYWIWREHDVFARQWANLSTMALTSILIAFPLLLYLVQNPYFLIERSRIIANRGAGTHPGEPWRTWFENIIRVGRGLIFIGDSNLSRNLPDRPYMDFIQAILATSGLISIAWNRFKREHIFLLLWLGVMLLPDILSGDAPHFGRLIGVAAPLAIMVSLGMVWLAERLTSWIALRNENAILISGSLLMVLLLVSASISTYDYFQRFPKETGLPEAFRLSDLQLGRYAATLPDESTVYLTPNQEHMATIYYGLAGDKEKLRSFHSPQDSLTPAGKPGQPAIYLIRPSADTVLDRLVGLFPEGLVDKSAPSFYAFWLTDGSEIEESDGVNLLSWGGAIALKESAAEIAGSQLLIHLTWQAIVDMSRDYTVFVHLLSEDGTLVSQRDRLPDGYPTGDWQPGEIVIDTFEIPLPDDLQPGTYFIQSGFYYLPSLERLGEPLILGEIELP